LPGGPHSPGDVVPAGWIWPPSTSVTGPAAFLILILGAIVVGLAIWLQLSLAPPFWVQVAIWVPLTLVGTIGSLRVTKAAMLALEYRTAAREGRITP
jgi:uncharacterized protein (DUF983 family)